VDTARDLACAELWQASLERSLARRGKPTRSSLELFHLQPERDLSRVELLRESMMYSQLRRSAVSRRPSMALPGAGGISALALLAATTLPGLLSGRTGSARTARITYRADEHGAQPPRTRVASTATASAETAGAATASAVARTATLPGIVTRADAGAASATAHTAEPGAGAPAVHASRPAPAHPSHAAIATAHIAAAAGVTGGASTEASTASGGAAPAAQHSVAAAGTPTAPAVHSTPAAHRTHTAHSTPAAHRTHTAHSTPAAHRTHTAHSTPAAHRTHTAHSTPAAHRTHTAHSTPAAHRTHTAHSTPAAHPKPSVHRARAAHRGASTVHTAPAHRVAPTVHRLSRSLPHAPASPEATTHVHTGGGAIEEATKVGRSRSKSTPTQPAAHPKPVVHPHPVATAQPAPKPAPAPAVAPGHYVNPLAGANVTRERIDQGVDYSGSGPLGAIGDGKITYVGTSGTGWPGAFIEYQLTGGSDAGKHVYYAEGVSPAAGLHVGETVKAGQKIAEIIAGSSSGIEIGWGSGVGTQPLAQALGEWSGGDDANSVPSAAGKDFSALIAELGGPPGKVEG